MPGAARWMHRVIGLPTVPACARAGAGMATIVARHAQISANRLKNHGRSIHTL
jgi:hypothetical protein